MARVKQTTIHRPSEFKIVDQAISSKKAAYKTERAIRVERNQKWANTPAEQVTLIQGIFKDYLLSLDYDDQDVKTLSKLFNWQVNESNIQNFIFRPARELYIALITDKLDEINNKTSKILKHEIKKS